MWCILRPLYSNGVVSVYFSLKTAEHHLQSPPHRFRLLWLMSAHKLVKKCWIVSDPNLGPCFLDCD